MTPNESSLKFLYVNIKPLCKITKYFNGVKGTLTFVISSGVLYLSRKFSKITKE